VEAVTAEGKAVIDSSGHRAGITLRVMAGTASASNHIISSMARKHTILFLLKFSYRFGLR